MIVKDEESFLEHALNSIKDVCDEIIIVDTGSKDDTKNIAKKYTKKVFNFRWKDDFSEARNFALKKATKSWILILDADERISKKDLKKIERLTKSKEFTGYSFIQRTYSKKKNGLKWNSAKNDGYKESEGFPGWNYRGITRLFKNDRKIKFNFAVHETVIGSIKKIDGMIKSTGMPIHHFAETKGKNFLYKKSKYYIKLLKKEVNKNPKANLFFELGLEMKKTGKNAAKKYFSKAVGLDINYKPLIEEIYSKKS